jgi:Xaa-Pro aminopeptidase
MGVHHAAARVRLRIVHLAFVAVAAGLAVSGVRAQRVGYPLDEFAVRRQKLAAAVKDGAVLMFGATEEAAGLRFRQDNDFYYLTGNESLNAAVLIEAPSGRAQLFLPAQDDVDVRYNGANWLREPDAAKQRGFTAIRPLTELTDALARRRSVAGPGVLWTRLSERDQVNFGRYDGAINQARRLANPFAQHVAEDAARVAMLRAQFPYLDVRDVTPALDRLRLIKSPREIETMTRNAHISAEAMTRAIQISGPGKFEYELEAEASYWMTRHGVQGAAYPAIVGSGPLGNRWHYDDNGRQLQAGELVVMDYGGSLDYTTIDITRTWPVSGRFTDAQLKAYRTVLEAQEAMIAAIRPGVTRAVVSKIAQDIYTRNGFDPAYAYIGHYVGMSVHDVGDWNIPFEAGMVLALEPIIDLPAQQMHVRVEDTLVVTETGTRVLTKDVPKDVEGLTRLVGTRKAD